MKLTSGLVVGGVGAWIVTLAAAAQPTPCVDDTTALQELLSQRHVAPTAQAIVTLCSDAPQALRRVALDEGAQGFARLRAIEALRTHNSPATRSLLARLAEQGEDPVLRWASFNYLDALAPAGDAHLARVAEAALGDRSVDMRLVAARCLGRRKLANASLRRAWRNEKNQQVRDAMSAALRRR